MTHSVVCSLFCALAFVGSAIKNDQQFMTQSPVVCPLFCVLAFVGNGIKNDQQLMTHSVVCPSFRALAFVVSMEPAEVDLNIYQKVGLVPDLCAGYKHTIV